MSRNSQIAGSLFAYCSLVFAIVSFSTRFWLSTNTGQHGFVSLGLWEVCFTPAYLDYPNQQQGPPCRRTPGEGLLFVMEALHPGYYSGVVQQGIGLSQPSIHFPTGVIQSTGQPAQWYQDVRSQFVTTQVFSALSLASMIVGSAITMFLHAKWIADKRKRTYSLFAAFLLVLGAVFGIVATACFGDLFSKSFPVLYQGGFPGSQIMAFGGDRELSWSFFLAVAATLASLVAGALLGYYANSLPPNPKKSCHHDHKIQICVCNNLKSNGPV